MAARRWGGTLPVLLRFLAGITGPLAATGIGILIGSGRTTTAALVYLLGILAVATVAGLGPGMLASILSFLGLNFFFTPPRHTFSVGKTDDLIALVVFLSVGVVVSTLVARGAAQRARAERREYETRSLYAISSKVLSGEDVEASFEELARIVRRLFGLARCEIRTRDGAGALVPHATDGDETGATSIDIPLGTTGGDEGVLVLFPGPGGFGEPQRQVATVFARQLGSALERAALEREAREARVAAETNRVRRALLSGVSHDFRTPLASIKAAVTALLGAGGPLAPEDANELLRTALEETERLERIVSNLLDLTRIRSGALAPERVPVRVEDLLDDTLSSVRARPRGVRVNVVVRPDTPPVFVDPVQMGQTLRNVLENAMRYAPPGSEIRVTATAWQGAVEIRVADRGPGIDPAERESVFEEFYQSGDGRVAGTGLGLAIAKAIVLAHGGRVWIEETPGGGATVAIRLPAYADAASSGAPTSPHAAADTERR